MMPRELTVKIDLRRGIIRYIIRSANTQDAVVVGCFKGLRATCGYGTSLDEY
jgi:hypothetical protein